MVRHTRNHRPNLPLFPMLEIYSLRYHHNELVPRIEAQQTV